MPGYRGRSPMQRFEDLTTPEPNTGCWLWMGCTTHDGYPLFGLANVPRTVRAHRWIAQAHMGPFPPGRDAHHTCHVRRCVNPAHLVPVEHGPHIAAHHAARRSARKAAA